MALRTSRRFDSAWALGPVERHEQKKENALIHKGTRANDSRGTTLFPRRNPGHSASDTMDAASVITDDEPDQVYCVLRLFGW